MSETTEEKITHVLYTDAFDGEREEWVRREIAAGTAERAIITRLV